MNPHSAFEAAVTRIAVATSVIRTREADIQRIENNGGLNGELYEKVATAAKDLRSVADRLEKAIA
jgi:hypothetical protein